MSDPFKIMFASLGHWDIVRYKRLFDHAINSEWAAMEAESMENMILMFMSRRRYSEWEDALNFVNAVKSLGVPRLTEAATKFYKLHPTYPNSGRCVVCDEWIDADHHCENAARDSTMRQDRSPNYVRSFGDRLADGFLMLDEDQR